MILVPLIGSVSTSSTGASDGAETGLGTDPHTLECNKEKGAGEGVPNEGEFVYGLRTPQLSQRSV